MPRLAANLSMMFNELPFLDRFAAARSDQVHLLPGELGEDQPPVVRS